MKCGQTRNLSIMHIHQYDFIKNLLVFYVIYHSADILNIFSHTTFLLPHLPFCQSSLTRSCQLLCHTQEC